ncbi:CorA Metal Ion Transporter (MIT) Family [Achlya hypogyna]|uniref:Magnesium transporter n=1 Tax=Achlya hypogyna TaxID=1202772 RepID=A0A1V9YWY1_ACHHY|nr:CorA Metal Ion Transporter (MIT) Family [Achlya hypogyna]
MDAYMAPEALLHRPYDLTYESSALNATGKRLALRFDGKGNSSFVELSRQDVYKTIQEAARGHEVHFPWYWYANEPSFRCQARRRLPRRKFPYAFESNLALTPYLQAIHMRDIRKLDNAFAIAVEPAFTIRRQAILLNADPLRVVILRDACLVFLPDGADSLVSLLKSNFKEHVAGESIAFEFAALEAVLATICKLVSSACAKIAPQATTVVDNMLHRGMVTSELETLRYIKNSLNELGSQVNGVRRALMDILENDEDVHMMYLTKLHAAPAMDVMSFDSEDAESLLEVYLQDIYGTQSRIALLLTNIQNTESMVMLKLDTKRNYLLTVDLTLTIWTTVLTVPTFLAGAFGMNLNSGIQESDYYFYVVFGVCAVFPIAMYIIIRQYLSTRGIDLSWKN